jgi:membrane-bound metal-dependent hydrolase YbcI (DUF457 family)
MKALTHSIFGAFVIGSAGLLLGHDARAELFAVAGITATMPDIDLPMSSIGQLFPPLSERVYRAFGHRSITHSVAGVGIAAIIFLPLRLLHLPELYTAAVLGYASHLMLDMANTEGIELSYPSNHRWVFPANPHYRFEAGHRIEQTIRIILVLLIGLLLIVQGIGGGTILHRVMGTPEAASTEYFQQLLDHRKTTVQLTGIWTRSQGAIDHETFEVVAVTDQTIFVRRPQDSRKIYTIGGAMSSISKVRIKQIVNHPAEQRIVMISFDQEPWQDDLTFRFPKALVSGRLVTDAKPPGFTIDEHPTIQSFNDYLELIHAPIELVDTALNHHTLTGTLHIRYWKMGSK